MVAEPGEKIEKRIAEEIYQRATAAAIEAKEVADKLEEEIAYLLEKAEHEKTETAWKDYFEAARYLRGKKDE